MSLRSCGCVVVSLALCLALVPAAAFGEEAKTEFEGWEGADKPATPPEDMKEAPAAEVSPAPVAPVAAAESATPAPLLPVVSTRWGSVNLLGVFQTLWNTRIVLDDDTATEAWGFEFMRARIQMAGHLLTEQLEYFFQGDARNMASFALDMGVKYTFGTSGLSIKFGRFIPDFSLIMPRSVHSIEAINYPTFITDGRFAIWRQIGIEAAYKASEKFELKLGVFNGMLAEPYSLGLGIGPGDVYMQMGTVGTFNNYLDNNKAKDFLLRANFFASKELLVAVSGWLGMPRNATVDENDLVIMGGPSVEYNNGKLHLLSEFMFRMIDYQPDGVDSITSLAVWAHAGYMMNSWLEGIFRIDWLEPNLDNDADMRIRITTGPQFWVEQKHFGILVNLFFDMGLEGEEGAKGEEIVGIQAQASLAW